uniref:Uncharacterized protein n=1 Tax=Oryza punctata TaxID=4537 RepID=A0A0E0M1Z8_ORYPU
MPSSKLPTHRCLTGRQVRPRPCLPWRRDAHIRIDEFLERIHTFMRRCYVLTEILTRFLRSSATVEAGILVNPSTTHRLIIVTVFVGTKFGGTGDVLPMMWTAVFEMSSDSVTVEVVHSDEVQWRRWSPLATRLSSTGAAAPARLGQVVGGADVVHGYFGATTNKRGSRGGLGAIKTMTAGAGGTREGKDDKWESSNLVEATLGNRSTDWARTSFTNSKAIISVTWTFGKIGNEFRDAKQTRITVEGVKMDVSHICLMAENGLKYV